MEISLTDAQAQALTFVLDAVIRDLSPDTAYVRCPEYPSNLQEHHMRVLSIRELLTAASLATCCA